MYTSLHTVLISIRNVYVVFSSAFEPFNIVSIYRVSVYISPYFSFILPGLINISEFSYTRMYTYIIYKTTKTTVICINFNLRGWQCKFLNIIRGF